MRRKVLQAATLMAGLSVSCALGGARVPPPAEMTGRAAVPAHSARAPCPPSKGRYNAEQLAVIMRLREDGASLREVARLVGGSREEIRRAERTERRRRARREPTELRAAAARPGDCDGLALR